jgi:hypothetical protein
MRAAHAKEFTIARSRLLCGTALSVQGMRGKKKKVIFLVSHGKKKYSSSHTVNHYLSILIITTISQ